MQGKKDPEGQGRECVFFGNLEGNVISMSVIWTVEDVLFGYFLSKGACPSNIFH